MAIHMPHYFDAKLKATLLSLPILLVSCLMVLLFAICSLRCGNCMQHYIFSNRDTPNEIHRALINHGYPETPAAILFLVKSRL